GYRRAGPASHRQTLPRRECPGGGHPVHRRLRRRPAGAPAAEVTAGPGARARPKPTAPAAPGRIRAGPAPRAGRGVHRPSWGRLARRGGPWVAGYFLPALPVAWPPSGSTVSPDTVAASGSTDTGVSVAPPRSRRACGPTGSTESLD